MLEDEETVEAFLSCSTKNEWQHLEEILDSCTSSREEFLRQAVDGNGSTALHYAAGSGSLETCQWLVEHSLHYDNTSHSNTCEKSWIYATSRNNGRTALHWAARNGHSLVCDYLITRAGFSVDVLAKGQVTPLQLAIWQCHIETCQNLVQRHGANPNFINHWGCSVAHWLAKCPLYQQQPSDESKSRIEACCHWLFVDCQVPYDTPNHHGQTPLHKAAFDGNLPFLSYLVRQYNVFDTVRDHQGNSAADCAERTQRHEIARWLRRFASALLVVAGEKLGLSFQPFLDTMTPSVIRRSFLQQAKKLHPDRDPTAHCGTTQWQELHQAYRLLMDWCQDSDHYDVQVRIQSRNAALQEFPMLCWTADWHQSDSQLAPTTQETELAMFERRLVSLLQTPAHHNGLSLAQLPKEYQKNWHSNLPRPQQYKCKKLVHLIQRHCPNVQVVLDATGRQQPRLQARPVAVSSG